MSYRHAIPPAKGKKKHWHGRNFWARAEWRVCPTCGARFWCTHNAQLFCDEKCRGARLSNADRLVLNHFTATCKRYRLAPAKIFTALAHCDRKEWYRFTNADKYGHMGKPRKDRFLTLLKKFVADLRAGWYDIERRAGTTHMQRLSNRTNYGADYMTILTRRITPGQPYCPMKLSHCRGALMPPDCPRGMTDCPMSQR